MEQDRRGKGQAQAAGAVLAAVDSERVHRQEPGKGKAEVAAGEAKVRGTVVRCGDAVEVPVKAQLPRLWM